MKGKPASGIILKVGAGIREIKRDEAETKASPTPLQDERFFSARKRQARIDVGNDISEFCRKK